MKKKINELSNDDLKNICDKYFNVYSGYDTCENCPLKINVIHCLKGLLDDKIKLKKRLDDIDKLIEEFLIKNKNKEVEV